MPDNIPSKHLLYNQAALLKRLYPSIAKVVSAENENAKQVVSKLTDYLGELNEENIMQTLVSIQTLFSVFASNGITGSSEIRARYEVPPIDTTKKILRLLKVFEMAKNLPSTIQLSAYSDNSLRRLSNFLRDIQTIAQMAEKEEMLANRELL